MTSLRDPGTVDGLPVAIRVVVVEDRPADAELMIIALRDEGFVPEWRRVETREALAEALVSEPGPDLVLTDWNLPRFGGLEAIVQVRAQDAEVPLIVVSGSVGEETAIDALHRGADDYVLKDRMARLGPAVRRALDARRLRAEQRRTELERDRLAAAIEQANESVVITDADARIIYVNPAFERSTGYTRDEVLGQNPRIVNSGTHPPAFYEAMWAAITRGEPWVAEFVNRRKDGSLFNERAHISPVLDPDGRIVNYVAVKHDVTRERALEAAALEAARDRALIADTLARLPTEGSAEETAEAICRQVVSLAGLAAVALLLFEHDGRAVPLAFVTCDGGSVPRWSLPEDRSEHLRSRALEGPWVEAWSPKPGHPYNQVLADLGAVAVAEAPARRTGELAGLLVAISAEPDAVDRLTAMLPALAEFADLAGALLGPAIEERTRTGRLHARISTAIYGEAFVPVFQPIVDLETRETVGFEALTRFASGDAPDRVFADAWAIGLGPHLEAATLEAAVRASARLPAGRWLSINLSPRLFAARGDVVGILRTADRPLVIEITEHETVHDYEMLRGSVRALGVDARLAVDDAGAGVANFGHIVGLRPDFVKLNFDLIRGVNRDVARQALLVGLRHFARTAGFRLIAEGVETEAEAETVAGLGVELGQGFLFGRPGPPPGSVDT